MGLMSRLVVRRGRSVSVLIELLDCFGTYTSTRLRPLTNKCSEERHSCIFINECQSIYTTPFSSSAASSDSGDRMVKKWNSRLYTKGKRMWKRTGRPLQRRKKQIFLQRVSNSNLHPSRILDAHRQIVMLLEDGTRLARGSSALPTLRMFCFLDS
jgi:hypothetical protein